MYLSSKVDLLENAEFNVRVKGGDGKTASWYEIQLYRLGWV